MQAAFHVDYWDHLGWKDPFGAATLSERQKRFCAAWPSQCYTPMLVTDGLSPSADTGKVEAALEQALESKPRASIELETALEGGKLEAKGSVSPAGSGALEKGLVLELLLVEDDVTTNCPKGENAGRKLDETAVVHEVKRPLALDAEKKDKTAFAATLAVEKAWKREKLRLIAALREPRTGAVWQALDVALVSSASAGK